VVVKSFKLFDDYVEAALQTARYQKIEDGTRVYADVPDFPGAWADGRTRNEATKTLRQVLRGWVELQLERGQSVPKLKGVQRPQAQLGLTSIKPFLPGDLSLF
jgi:predicted RNase H-like HicB family nuclease